jgi:3-hydroxyisobutyrate dehydrogenase
MGQNILKRGFPLTVYNRSRQPMDILAGEGARLAASPREVGAQSDVVITMLPDGPDVEQVVTGTDGVLEGLGAGGIIVDMSTINPLISQRLAAQCAQHGVSFLDAPVSGGTRGARAGTLTIMVGGDAGTLERARPILEAVGGCVIHVGNNGMGEVVKLVNQMMVAANVVAMTEAFALGTKAGADPKIMHEVIMASTGRSFALENYLPFPGIVPHAPVNHDFAPGFMTDLMLKDISLVIELARRLGSPVFTAGIAQQYVSAASAHGWGRKDYTVLVRVVQDLGAQSGDELSKP